MPGHYYSFITHLSCNTGHLCPWLLYDCPCMCISACFHGICQKLKIFVVVADVEAGRLWLVTKIMVVLLNGCVENMCGTRYMAAHLYFMGDKFLLLYLFFFLITLNIMRYGQCQIIYEYLDTLFFEYCWKGCFK